MDRSCSGVFRGVQGRKGVRSRTSLACSGVGVLGGVQGCLGVCLSVFLSFLFVGVGVEVGVVWGC